MPSGTRLVVVLTVDPFGNGAARLMVDDPLPAGFEIDNPNLMQAGDIGALDWLDLNAYAAAHRVPAGPVPGGGRLALSDKPFRLAYIVRAISPGHLPPSRPPASSTCTARSSAPIPTPGTVTVTE